MECPNCNNEIGGETSFCMRCGFNLDDASMNEMELNPLSGTNKYNTLLNNGFVNNAEETMFKPYIFRFGDEFYLDVCCS